jgi:hypothetical protein
MARQNKTRQGECLFPVLLTNLGVRDHSVPALPNQVREKRGVLRNGLSVRPDGTSGLDILEEPVRDSYVAVQQQGLAGKLIPAKSCPLSVVTLISHPKNLRFGVSAHNGTMVHDDPVINVSQMARMTKSASSRLILTRPRLE